MKTPLTSINANAQMLLRWGDRDPKIRRESLETIAAESASLAEMVNGMLTLAKADRGDDIPKEPVSLAQVASEASPGTAQPRARSKHLDARRFEHDGTPTVFGDPALLRQLIGNLIDNAIKFTERGGGRRARRGRRDAGLGRGRRQRAGDPRRRAGRTSSTASTAPTRPVRAYGARNRAWASRSFARSRGSTAATVTAGRGARRRSAVPGDVSSHGRYRSPTLHDAAGGPAATMKACSEDLAWRGAAALVSPRSCWFGLAGARKRRRADRRWPEPLSSTCSCKAARSPCKPGTVRRCSRHRRPARRAPRRRRRCRTRAFRTSTRRGRKASRPTHGIVALPEESFVLPQLAGSSHDAVVARGQGNTTITVPRGTALVTAHVGTGSSTSTTTTASSSRTSRDGGISLNHVDGSGYAEALRGPVNATNSSFDRLRVRTATGNMLFRGCTSHQIEATSKYGSIVYDNGSFQPGLARFESRARQRRARRARRRADRRPQRHRAHRFELSQRRGGNGNPNTRSRRFAAAVRS